MDGTAVHTLERWAWRVGLSLLPLLGVLQGAPAQAQPTPRVSISLTNEPLREALLHLERVTPLRFAYVDTLVTPHTVSITAEDDLLPDVLDRLLHPLGIGWTQRGQQVILRGQAPTPPTLTMQGRVVDAATGLVLPLAHVRLVATGQATVTDGQGRFSFTGLAPGAYEIEARYLGYTTQRWTLTPPEVRTLRLAPTPLAVGELVVAADVLPAVQRPDTAGLLRLVPEALERLPAIGEPDVLRALLTTPGVHVGHDASIGLFIRGGTPDQHLIRLDGMTLYQVDHLFGVFSPFNPDALHAVHVFKGGFPASYGARTGSVINLESHPALDRPGPTPPRLRVRAGLLSTSVAVRGPLRPRLDGAVAVRRALTDLWTSPLAATVVDVSTGEAIDEEAEERRFGFSDLHATLRWRRTPTDQWSLHGFASRDRFEQRDAPSTPEEAPDILETLTSRWTTGAGSLRWQRQWHPRVKTTATWTRSSYQTRYDLTSTLDLDPFYALSLRNTVDEWAVRLDGEAALGTAHTLRLGASYTDLRVGLREIQEERRIRDDDREALTALYVEDRWRLAPSLTVTTGLRATQARESEQLFLAPRAAFQWQPTRTWTLHGAWGHYRQWTGRVVNENVLDGPRDLWVILPNVSESRHQSLGVRYDGRLGRATLEAYRHTSQALA
ncbi:MAG: TonB-dependent receptor, partial [Bacteroidota bacterium]